jgi:peptidyl-prolyl cis-trans isomerase C
MKLLHSTPLFFCLAAGLYAWQQAAPVADDAMVLKVGDFSLTKAEYEKLILGFDRASGALATGATPQSVQSAQDVARLLALVTEAQHRKMDQDPAMLATMKVRGYVLLANSLLAKLEAEMKNDEAGTREFYQSEQHNYYEVHARHILFRYKGVKSERPIAKGLTRTESQAKGSAEALYRKLKAGADFAAAAKVSSDDETTNSKGGDLTYFMRGAMTGEFEIVAFRLPIGGLSEPFKTEYGYHIVQVLDHRPLPFEKIRAALENIRARQKYEEIAKRDIQINESYFKK